jgi:septum formation protein|tara:strand:- start:665 stop:1255 length:591 start_codon:yes stop_codon:yes gene_type:complete
MRNTINKNIILASSSVHRKKLLAKYISHFQCINPDVNEAEFNKETGKELCIRLARDKAQIVANDNPNSIVIGSDQVATFNQKNLGKPYTYETAFKTIMRFSGKNVFFNTGVVIISPNKGIDLSYIDQTIIAFKTFKNTDLIPYLDSQDDFRTTAGVKTESEMFQQLISEITCVDKEAIIGLPIQWTLSQLDNILLI